MGGAALLVAGCILYGIGELIDSLVRAGTAKMAEAPSPSASAPSTSNLEPTTCEWCNRTLRGGFLTCTSFDSEGLRDIAPKVSDPVCQKELRTRGFLPDQATSA